MFIRKCLIWFRKFFCFLFESKIENSIKGFKKNFENYFLFVRQIINNVSNKNIFFVCLVIYYLKLYVLLGEKFEVSYNILYKKWIS